MTKTRLQSLRQQRIQEQCQVIYANNSFTGVNNVIKKGMLAIGHSFLNDRSPDYHVRISPLQNQLQSVPMSITCPIRPASPVHIPESFSVGLQRRLLPFEHWILSTEIFVFTQKKFASDSFIQNGNERTIMGHCVECRMFHKHLLFYLNARRDKTVILQQIQFIWINKIISTKLRY